jgi:glutamine synthetase type III
MRTGTNEINTGESEMTPQQKEIHEIITDSDYTTESKVMLIESLINIARREGLIEGMKRVHRALFKQDEVAQ